MLLPCHHICHRQRGLGIRPWFVGSGSLQGSQLGQGCQSEVEVDGSSRPVGCSDEKTWGLWMERLLGCCQELVELTIPMTAAELLCSGTQLPQLHGYLTSGGEKGCLGSEGLPTGLCD